MVTANPSGVWPEHLVEARVDVMRSGDSAVLQNSWSLTLTAGRKLYVNKRLSVDLLNGHEQLPASAFGLLKKDSAGLLLSVFQKKDGSYPKLTPDNDPSDFELLEPITHVDLMGMTYDAWRADR